MWLEQRASSDSDRQTLLVPKRLGNDSREDAG